MRPTRALRKRAQARKTPAKAEPPVDPMKGFQTAGGGSQNERAGRRYYEAERGGFYNPIVMSEAPRLGFRPNEENHSG